MEVHFTSEVEKKLQDLAAQNVIEAYFDERMASRGETIRTGGSLNPHASRDEAIAPGVSQGIPTLNQHANDSTAAETSEMLDRRYDDLKSGRIKPVPGEEVETHFREKTASARRSRRS